jgi:guanylate kinase
MSVLKRQGILFCLLGPAGSGKTTMAKRLLKDLNGTMIPSISITTRPPRAYEVHGKHYYFVSREEFLEGVQRDEFFEWEEVHGNLYGTPKDTLDDAMLAGVDVILDIDIKGARSFYNTYPYHTVSLFLIPPSIDELKQRIINRGCSTAEEIERRLATSKAEFQMLLDPSNTGQASGFQVDYCVLNDDLEEAYKAVMSIVAAERAKLRRLDSSVLKNICGIGS